MQKTRFTETLLYGLLFLFFLQALADFIQSIYAFGLLVTAFTVEVASIVLLFTPLLLVFFRRQPSRAFLTGLVWLAILARLLEPMLLPGGRLVACGVSVGAFMLLFPCLLHGRPGLRGGAAASGLALALGLSILFRTAGSGLDLSETGAFQAISWALGLLAGWLFLRADRTPSAEAPASARGPVTVFALGLASVILLLYFALTNPTVMARWTGAPLAPILIALTGALVVFSLLAGSGFLSRLSLRVIAGWNIAFLLMLVLSILPHQVSYPINPRLFPVPAHVGTPADWVWLYLMLLLSPVLFVDFRLFLRQIARAQPSLRQLGGGFAAAALFFLVMVFFHVFTTIYDYAPVVGPLFRDRFAFVHLLAGLGLLLPLPFVRKTPDASNEAAPRALAPVMAGLALLTLAAFFLTRAAPVPPAPSQTLKVMTYNIQQGFDKAGNQNLEGQLAVIRSVNPDILGLQESDTARIANGNVDAVRYLADRLDMYSYYGPTTTSGTFGIALLSKYPIEDASTFFMRSEGEQTASIQARVEAGGRIWNVFVTHLGNSGPMVQLEDMLVRVDGLENVIAMGDFNFRPDTDQYARMTGLLQDSWLLMWPGGKEIPGYSPDRRIDHIFVSPGTNVTASEYSLDPASDHPYMYSVLGGE